MPTSQDRYVVREVKKPLAMFGGIGLTLCRFVVWDRTAKKNATGSSYLDRSTAIAKARGLNTGAPGSARIDDSTSA
jgi:hypothetical protein